MSDRPLLGSTTSAESETERRTEQAAHYERKLAFETDAFDLHAAVEAGKDITIVDTRSAAAYQDEHIAGAVHLSHREMSAATTADIDTESLVVTYCDGIGCNAATKGARNMLQLGFEVRELVGGLSWWKRDGYETHQRDEAADTPVCGCG